MKSHMPKVVAIMDGIISDTITMLPDCKASLEKDSSYLRRAIEERGLPFFLVTLPDYCKYLERSLELSVLDDDIPQGIPSSRGRPILFGSLLSRIFEPCGQLRASPCIDSITAFRQLTVVFKRFRIDCPDAAKKKSLDAFYDCERSLVPPRPSTWYSDSPVWSSFRGHPNCGPDIPFDMASGHPWDWDLYRRICRLMISTLGEVPYWDMTPKHGPGVVSEYSEGWFNKWNLPYWTKRLDPVFPHDWYASFSPEYQDYELRLPASRLIMVPKTQKSPRIICAEPLVHQWIQQAVWNALDSRVGSSLFAKSVTFHSQDTSRERCVLGSIDRSLSTIDLSEASDRLSARLVEYVFQETSWLDAFHACRTEYLEQRLSDGHPGRVRLKKFAPMGSALTFPVQSIVFTTLAVFGVCSSRGIKPRKRSDIQRIAQEVTVFGDDIIVPTDCHQMVTQLLHEVGLKVNTDKSFWKGYFRESCGEYAYRGVSVSSAYYLFPYDGSPDSLTATVEASNNFFLRGYWNTASAIEREIPEKERKLIPVVPWTSGAFGFISSGSFGYHLLKKRWNRDYQRYEYRTLSVTSKVTRVRGRGRADYIQYCIEQPHGTLSSWQAGQVSKATPRKRVAWSPLV